MKKTKDITIKLGKLDIYFAVHFMWFQKHSRTLLYRVVNMCTVTNSSLLENFESWNHICHHFAIIFEALSVQIPAKKYYNKRWWGVYFFHLNMLYWISSTQQGCFMYMKHIIEHILVPIYHTIFYCSNIRIIGVGVFHICVCCHGYIFKVYSPIIWLYML